MKNRILLVFDEFIESEKWHNLLLKMGFTVESIRNEVSLLTQLLSLRPDAVFILGQGLLLNPIRVLERLKGQSWFNGKVILFESSLMPLNPQDLQGYHFDGLLTMADFSAVERLEILSQALDIDYNFLHQKYSSTFGLEAESVNLAGLRHSPNLASIKPKLRDLSDYKKLKTSEGQGHLSTGIDKALLVQKLTEANAKAQQESSALDKKREFVRALFKKP